MPGVVIREWPDDRHWFEWYLARQVILAEALAQGYGRRLEVEDMVDRMSRHMLAREESEGAPPSESELQAAYERYPAANGQPKPAFGSLRPVLLRKLIQDGRTARIQHRLRAASLEIFGAMATQLAQLLRTQWPPQDIVPAEMTAPLADRRLAIYELDGHATTLTVEDWRTCFNRLFVRELPRTPAGVEASVRGMVAEDCFSRDARARGADRKTQFVEDRRNFLYFQVLDRFEQEKLLPMVAVAAADAEAYYREHASAFVRAASAKGRLLSFVGRSSAIAWLQSGGTTPISGAEPIEVSRASPLPGATAATDFILHLPAGRPFGPIPMPSGAKVFLKLSTVTEQQSYSAVAPEIHAILSRQELNALELKLARNWAPQFVIEDHIQPRDYGIAGPIAKPWIGAN